MQCKALLTSPLILLHKTQQMEEDLYIFTSLCSLCDASPCPTCFFRMVFALWSVSLRPLQATLWLARPVGTCSLGDSIHIGTQNAFVSYMFLLLVLFKSSYAKQSGDRFSVVLHGISFLGRSMSLVGLL